MAVPASAMVIGLLGTASAVMMEAIVATTEPTAVQTMSRIAVIHDGI